jgi:hypothetical protein
MKAGDTNLFEELTPPAGGLGQLRARLDQEPARQRRRRSAAAAGLAITAAGIILAVLLIPPGQPDLHTDLTTILAANPAAVRLGLANAPAEPVSIAPDQRHRMAVQRVEVADQKVLYYRVTVLNEPSS